MDNLICDFCKEREGICDLIGSVGENGPLIPLTACCSDECNSGVIKALKIGPFTLTTEYENDRINV